MKKLLHLEDSPQDAELIAGVLNRTWPQCAIDRVSSQPAFLAALERGGYDLILSDFSLPGFLGSTALELARSVRPEIPFIFISGTIGEERAIEAMKHGALDYIIKDRPDRLVPAIRHALRYREESAARRRSEEALRLSQERHRLVVENARDAIFTLAENGTITGLNSAFERITGWPREQWIGRIFHDLIHPDDLPRALDHFERSRHGEVGEIFELRIPTANGGEVDLEFAITPLIEALGITGIGRDITERKRSLTRLHEQAEIINRAPMAVVVTDLSHRIIYANKGVRELCGLEPAAVIGRTAEDLLPAETMRTLGPARDIALNSGSWHGEVPVQTPDGRELFVESFMSVIRDDDGRTRARMSVGIDITERRKLETQLQRAARLDSIGMLAGGIAHDINNVLAPILIGVDLLRRGVSDETPLRVLNSMERSAHHGANLVRQLLAFARGEEIQRVETRLGPLIDDVRNLLSRTLPRGVSIQSACEPDIGPVLADGTQLKQVLLNLCINARDAMSGSGRIDLVAARATSEELRLHAPQAASRPHLRISVSDTGMGIPPALLTRLFDPFFTTKGTGKGTGLGLSTVRGIIQKHEGVIEVESEVGRGTTFHVFLPELSKRTPASSGLASAEPESNPHGHGELVLIVDRETGNLGGRCRDIEQFGYRTTQVGGLISALDWLQQNRGQAAAALVNADGADVDVSDFLEAVSVLDPEIRIATLGGDAPPHEPGLTKDLSLSALLLLLQRLLAGAAKPPSSLD